MVDSEEGDGEFNDLTAFCSSHRQADAVQDLLQSFGLGRGVTVLAVAAPHSGHGAFVGEDVDVDELEGAHLAVELPGPGAHRRLVDDVDDVSFLRKRRL